MKLKHLGLFTVVGVIIVIGILFLLTRTKQIPLKTVQANRQTVVSEVAFTGNLQSKRKVELAFELTGTVKEVNVKVGDRIKMGDVLMRLDTRGARLSAAQASAALYSGQEQARLSWQTAENSWDKTRQENSAIIAKYQQDVRNSKAQLDQSKITLEQTARESGDESSVTKTKQEAAGTLGASYKTAQQLLDQVLASATKNNQATRDAADSAYAKYAATVKASGDKDGLSVLEASSALANLQLVKSVALSPFDGVVTSRSINNNELAVAGTPVISVETIDDLEIKADVPESDIAKLTTGMAGVFSLDAYATSDDVFGAEITTIAPSAKTIEGVPTYEVTLVLHQPDARLKPGMTANVTVRATEKKDVVALPRRAVSKVNGKNIVKVLQSNNETKDQEVSLGLQGSNGLVEITGGLSGGETIVLSTTSGS